MFEQKNLQDIEAKILYNFKNKNLIEQAFTHSSYANLHNLKSNETL